MKITNKSYLSLFLLIVQAMALSPSAQANNETFMEGLSEIALNAQSQGFDGNLTPEQHRELLEILGFLQNGSLLDADEISEEDQDTIRAALVELNFTRAMRRLNDLVGGRAAARAVEFHGEGYEAGHR